MIPMYGKPALNVRNMRIASLLISHGRNVRFCKLSLGGAMPKPISPSYIAEGMKYPHYFHLYKKELRTKLRSDFGKVCFILCSIFSIIKVEQRSFNGLYSQNNVSLSNLAEFTVPLHFSQYDLSYLKKPNLKQDILQSAGPCSQ